MIFLGDFGGAVQGPFPSLFNKPVAGLTPYFISVSKTGGSFVFDTSIGSNLVDFLTQKYAYYSEYVNEELFTFTGSLYTEMFVDFAPTIMFPPLQSAYSNQYKYGILRRTSISPDNGIPGYVSLGDTATGFDFNGTTPNNMFLSCNMYSVESAPSTLTFGSPITTVDTSFDVLSDVIVNIIDNAGNFLQQLPINELSTNSFAVPSYNGEFHLQFENNSSRNLVIADILFFWDV